MTSTELSFLDRLGTLEARLEVLPQGLEKQVHTRLMALEERLSAYAVSEALLKLEIAKLSERIAVVQAEAMALSYTLAQRVTVVETILQVQDEARRKDSPRPISHP